jgi:hypothetical protein
MLNLADEDAFGGLSRLARQSRTGAIAPRRI